VEAVAVVVTGQRLAEHMAIIMAGKVLRALGWDIKTISAYCPEILIPLWSVLEELLEPRLVAMVVMAAIRILSMFAS
jgi:hypothetical protein